MLIQLPGGAWVDPSDVKSVEITDQFGVKVETTSCWYDEAPQDSVEAAEALRDQIAEQVNRALYKPEGTP